MMSPSPRTTACAPPSSMGLVGIQRGVDAAEHDARAARAHALPDLVAAKRVAGVNADADDVAGLNARPYRTLPGFRRRSGRAIRGRCRARQHEQPTGRDDADAEREMAWVHKMDSHALLVVSERASLCARVGRGLILLS